MSTAHPRAFSLIGHLSWRLKENVPALCTARTPLFPLVFLMGAQICCTVPSRRFSLPPALSPVSLALALSSSPAVFPSPLPNFLPCHCDQATVTCHLGFYTIHLLFSSPNLSSPKLIFQSSQADSFRRKSDRAPKRPALTRSQRLPVALRMQFKLSAEVCKGHGSGPSSLLSIVSKNVLTPSLRQDPLSTT